MDTFVLDAQASEVRCELLKERKKRFELEAKVRILEQQLAQASSSRPSSAVSDPKRPSTPAEGLSDDSNLFLYVPPSTSTHSPSPPVNTSATLLSSDFPAAKDSAANKSEIFDLEAERNWINSVRLPSASHHNHSDSLQRDSTSASDANSLVGEEVDGGSETASIGDLDFVVVPSQSQGGNRVLRPVRELSLSGGVPLAGSPTMNGSISGLDSKMSTFGSSWSLQDSSKRRYDDALLRVSQLRIELADYQQVLSETSLQLSASKRLSSFLSSELESCLSRLDLLRDQVRSKNSQILGLIAENRAVEALKSQLEGETKVKLSVVVDMNVLMRKYEAVVESEEALKRQVSALQETIRAKEVEVGQKDLMMQKMAEKLMQLKLQLQAIVPHLCKFSVSTVVRFGKPLVVSIGVLKPTNAQRTRELEIVTSGKRVTHPSSSVASIAPSSSTKDTDRFTVTYRNGNSDVFESTRREEVLKVLNECLFSQNSDHDDTTIILMPPSPSIQTANSSSQQLLATSSD